MLTLLGKVQHTICMMDMMVVAGILLLFKDKEFPNEVQEQRSDNSSYEHIYIYIP